MCNIKDRQSNKHKVIFSLPILITPIFRSWMLEDEYNEMNRDRVMIAIESKTTLYFASLQIDWMKETAHADIHVAPSRSLPKKMRMMINILNKSHLKTIDNSW